ncbi:HAMP domain-containing sensor histidine kinase [Actinoplanes sp. NBRC 103695]|uniref:sensor histidine kinase n=1 Tax=Actinoplanes sp. NBRC 103695 TaxID=3032202 RepID=UPI0024A4F572|nr:HAMP domain-containing sensor histidine kinase [Actinoplanes sp. NBRC 103695]GLY99950.1 two-component sensor histidine kinase [Actinoplanes sp. NBRC 103695]
MTRVPPHRSLIVRLLVASLTIAVAAIVAASWLASQATSRTIQQQLGQSLSDDKGVYDELLGYAATHRDWSGVRPLVATRAAKLDRRITLMTVDREVIVDSRAGPSLATARPSATVDPLSVDPGLAGRTGRIDPRVVGPYRTTPAEQRQIRAKLAESMECIRHNDADGQIVDGPHGRPTLVVTNVSAKPNFPCAVVPPATPTETRALASLGKLIAACAGADPRKLLVGPDLSVRVLDEATGWFDQGLTDRAAGCVDQARRTQLEPYAAPPALLFVTDPADPTAQAAFPLSRQNLIRTGTATAVVLILAVLVTILVGGRLVRPLRALTEAAQRPADNQRVAVTSRDEIGYLATALNELAERRELAERQRKAMVNDVAHELRNPLTNIRSWLEAVQDGLATVDGPLLTLLHDETVHLQHIVDDLRDLAAADAGSLRMHPEALHVNDAVDQVVDAHLPNAGAGGVRLVTEYAGDPEVVADPVRLRQLVGNLLSNAIRHSRPGDAVTVRTGVEADRLSIAVIDTGAGIAAEDLPRLFDRFWRADESRNRATGGSGLGLPIARKIAEAHGGDITVESRLGSGTTFTATLMY